MIITLTPNTGVDHTVQVSSFQLNDTIRAIDSAWGMGGKATDVSWILGKLGVPTRALGFAAGATGQRMENMLRERGVETDFVWVNGESRLNTVLVVAGEGQSTITSSTLNISPEHVMQFRERYQIALKSASCVVVGGSLPNGLVPQFFAETISQAHEHNVPVIFDSSGPSLVAGIQSRPKLIKPNQTELSDILGFMPNSPLAILQAAKNLKKQFGVNVIVTLGEAGAITVFEEGSYFVQPLSIPIISVAGAGDGVLAGMALAYSRKESFTYGLQHGFALAGAILKTLATADFQIRDYTNLLSQVNITPI